MIKRLLLILFLLFGLLGIVFANCVDINYSVSYVGVDDTGCYDGLQINLYKDNCTGTMCFAMFERVIISTEIEQLANLSNEYDVITNPFIIIKKEFDCTNGIPEFLNLDLKGESDCSFSFAFNDKIEEREDYYKNLECEELGLIYDKLVDDCIEKFDDNEEGKEDDIIEPKNGGRNDDEALPITVSTTNNIFDDELIIITDEGNNDDEFIDSGNLTIDVNSSINNVNQTDNLTTKSSNSIVEKIVNKVSFSSIMTMVLAVLIVMLIVFIFFVIK